MDENSFLNMKRLFYTLIFLLIFILSFGCAESPEAKKETLKVAVRKLNEALMKGDISFAEKMMTDSYRHLVGAEKTLDKDTLIYFLKTNKEQVKSGQIEIMRYAMDDIEMDMSENSAIVTGRVQVRIKIQELVKNYNYRIRHLWLFEKGSWKRTGFYKPTKP
jgi:hypothetical protein